ncbi:MAG: hypothetical protein LUE88_03085 [Clostridiales bacterium]|nr:hypothetical protein [Clostridiales bacterium]
MDDNKLTENKMTEEELAQKQAELEQKEKELEEKYKNYKSLDEKVVGVKESIYSHINVSLKTMNIVVAVLAIALVVCIVVGIATR